MTLESSLVEAGVERLEVGENACGGHQKRGAGAVRQDGPAPGQLSPQDGLLYRRTRVSERPPYAVPYVPSKSRVERGRAPGDAGALDGRPDQR